MKYAIFNLKTNEYLSTSSNFTKEIYELKWTQYYYNAFQMHFDQANEMFDDIEKQFPNLKIEIREL